jgi:hypothetical protein
MPRKPSKEEIDAAKNKLDPKAVVEVIINETPELKDALLNAGLVVEVED